MVHQSSDTEPSDIIPCGEAGVSPDLTAVQSTVRHVTCCRFGDTRFHFSFAGRLHEREVPDDLPHWKAQGDNGVLFSCRLPGQSAADFPHRQYDAGCCTAQQASQGQ